MTPPKLPACEAARERQRQGRARGNFGLTNAKGLDEVTMARVREWHGKLTPRDRREFLRAINRVLLQFQSRFDARFR